VANRKHLEILEQGVFEWNRWREERPDIVPDLSEAYLREANLVGFDLRDSSLHAAMMLGADLSNADLRGANLSDADIRFAELKGARLAGARLERTKGVTAGILRRAQRPMRLQRKLAESLWPTLLAVVVVGGVVLAVKTLALSGDESEPEAAPAAATTLTPPPEEPRGALTTLLESLRFPEWSIEKARVQGSVLTIELSVDDVDETIYLPTLAAACGALEGLPNQSPLREIRILDRTGENGWAYDRPRNCPAIMQAPTHMLRLAAGADSLRWTAQ